LKCTTKKSINWK